MSLVFHHSSLGGLSDMLRMTLISFGGIGSGEHAGWLLPVGEDGWIRVSCGGVLARLTLTSRLSCDHSAGESGQARSVGGQISGAWRWVCSTDMGELGGLASLESL